MEFDRLITAWHRSNEMSMRLDEAPGVGPVLATAVVATVADPKVFRSGATSRPGSGSCRSSIRAEARTGSAVSANKETAICAACSWPACSPSSAMPRSMAPNIGHGSPRCCTAANQGCCYRARQQDCTDGLGHDGQGRAIQGTRRACGVNEIAPGIRRDVKVGRRTAGNAEPVDPAIKTTHLCQRICRMRAFDRALIRGGHYASGHVNRI